MNGVGTVCLGFLMIAAAGSAAAQTARPASPPAPRQAQAQPQRQAAPAQQAQRKAPADQAVSRGIFISRMDAEFRKMDADKNGTVTRTEVADFERAISILKTKSANRALFARLDADRNGQISPAEFTRLASAPPAPNPAATLGRFDLNRDQSITLVEYRTGTLKNFDRMDADKDGIVSPAEMKATGAGR